MCPRIPQSERRDAKRSTLAPRCVRCSAGIETIKLKETSAILVSLARNARMGDMAEKIIAYSTNGLLIWQSAQ